MSSHYFLIRFSLFFYDRTGSRGNKFDLPVTLQQGNQYAKNTVRRHFFFIC